MTPSCNKAGRHKKRNNPYPLHAKKQNAARHLPGAKAKIRIKLQHPTILDEIVAGMRIIVQLTFPTKECCTGGNYASKSPRNLHFHGS